MHVLIRVVLFFFCFFFFFFFFCFFFVFCFFFHADMYEMTPYNLAKVDDIITDVIVK